MCLNAVYGSLQLEATVTAGTVWLVHAPMMQRGSDRSWQIWFAVRKACAALFLSMHDGSARARRACGPLEAPVVNLSHLETLDSACCRPSQLQF